MHGECQFIYALKTKCMMLDAISTELYSTLDNHIQRILNNLGKVRGKLEATLMYLGHSKSKTTYTPDMSNIREG